MKNPKVISTFFQLEPSEVQLINDSLLNDRVNNDKQKLYWIRCNYCGSKWETKI